MKEVDTALKKNPSNIHFLARRGKYYYQYNLGPSVKKLFEACQKVVDGSHQDARHLRHIYAIMADITIEFSALGTFNDALVYFQKMVACELKQVQLYTKQRVEMECQTCFTREAHYKFSDKYLTAEWLSDRKTSDVCKSIRAVDIASKSSLMQKCNARCMNCDNDEHDGIELFKCGGCKQVNYCSKECQTNNWKSHQKACKLLAELTMDKCKRCKKSKRDGVKLSKCGRGLQIFYYSREYQRADWSRHKKSCKIK